MISGIILASGFSRRMRKEKLTLEVDGIPMLERVICAAKASCLDEILLIYRTDDIRKLGEIHGLTVVHNLHPEEGLSAAVKSGVICAHPESDGYMFLVGDQPYISTAGIDRLITEFKKDMSRIVVPCYGGRRGNPVIFPCALRKELLAVKGDQGGRVVTDTMTHLITPAAMPDVKEATDIDTAEEYEQNESDHL